MKELWLDPQTVAPPAPEIFSAWKEACESRLSSDVPYHRSLQASSLIKEALESIFALVGANKEKDLFVFTSGIEEAISQIVSSLAPGRAKNNFITLETEMAPIYLSLLEAKERHGIEVSFLKVGSNGKVAPDDVEKAVSENTALLSLSMSAPLIGSIQDLGVISKIVHEKGALLHVDISLTLASMRVAAEAIGADYITFDGQDIGSIPGTGALFVRNGAPIHPRIWGHQCRERYRGGPLNIPALMAMGLAAKKQESSFSKSAEIARLKNLFESELQKKVAEAKILFQAEVRLPSLSVIIFPGIKNELLLFSLHEKKLFASIGGARFQNIDMVLEASGFERKEALSAIAFSFSERLTDEDIFDAVERISASVNRYKRLK